MLDELQNSEHFYEVPFANLTSLRQGDIIITNSTSVAGVLGHAGIATSPSTILHIIGLERKLIIKI